MIFTCSYGSAVKSDIGKTEESRENRLFATYDTSEWGNLGEVKELPVLDPSQTSQNEFFRRFLSKNMPCMFSSGISSNWLSRQMWIREGTDEVDFENLLGIYGDAQVSAVNCDDAEYKDGYGTRDCRDMSFEQYAKYWKAYIDGGYSTDSPCLYLKDWHIVRFHESKRLPCLPYETPFYFASDWLNEACEYKNADDFKFCYMGPSGSFTSFHADVYGSYSWSANIVGVKKWYLYPPGKELRFFKSGKMSFRWEDPGTHVQDYIEVIQNAGECIFVPSGWHHVVWNLTDTISINHNWFNGTNICYIWNVLQNALMDVERELEDLKEIPEFCEQCQLVLKANHGMNYEGFFEVLQIICKNRENEATLTTQTSYDLEAVKHLIYEHCIADANVAKHFTETIAWFSNFFKGKAE